MGKNGPPPNGYLVFLTVIFSASLAISAFRPHDYFTWFLEVAPAMLAFAVLALSRRNFRFTNLAYTLILIHAVILMIGGHYTYAEVPWFNWLKENFEFSRNHYDRIGHFFQGFVPALVLREIVIRKKIIARNWQPFFIILTCLGFSALYELFEWWVAIGTGTAATAFLGTQGDVWDTQWDMFLCLVGSTVSLMTLPKIHDRELKKIP